MPHRPKHRPIVIFAVASLAAMLLGACGGSPNKATPLPADTPIVYTTYTSGSGPAVADGLAAISGRDGKTLWHTAIGRVNGAPLAIGNRVFAASEQQDHYDMAAVDMRDGKVLW